MPVPKLSASGAPNVMKSDGGNDSVDTIVRQAIGKDPLLSFSRTGDNPVQWIQLLHALDQQDLPGWPLMTPLKVQMQKCEKCSREFFSPINYRRHIRMHRRSLNVDKGSYKNRDLLGAFWDKLSSEETKEVASFENVSLKEVSGSSVVNALAISLRKPGAWTLPQVYVKAGSFLLDIIQGRSSRHPVSSQELFSILDDASERTFLCGGTALSVQKYVIEGEPEKALETKNIVACASLLFELKLVKAWLADKDAEALRCQKLLVEEEEAAQKRQAQLLERKKQKKLRQKEQKARELLNGEEADTSADPLNGSISAEISIPPVLSDLNSNGAADTLEDMGSSLYQIQYSTKVNDEDVEAQFDLNVDSTDMDSIQNVNSRTELGNGRRHFTINRWQVPKTHWAERNGLHVSHNLQASKVEPKQKQGPSKDRSTLANGGKVWARKSISGVDDDGSRPKVMKMESHQVDVGNCEVMIGSISVPVRKYIAQQQVKIQRARTDGSAEHAVPVIDDVLENTLKLDSIESVTNGEFAELWKPSLASERDNKDSEETATLAKIEERTSSSVICLQSCAVDTDDSDSRKYCFQGVKQPGGLLFSSSAAKAFLAKRWKDAISADHVKLVFSPKSEPSMNLVIQNELSVITPPLDSREPRILYTENRQVGVGAPVSSSKGNAKTKFRGGTKIKYVPKQKI